MSLPRLTAQRFWARLRYPDDKQCWVWPGARQGRGYGRAHWDGAKMQAHRLAYQLTYGPLRPVDVVCHRCDNPPCCNPAHLFRGTQTENMQDMARKGRSNGGRKKLDAGTVRLIRRLLAAGTPMPVVARVFSVTTRNIRHIASGATWRNTCS